MTESFLPQVDRGSVGDARVRRSIQSVIESMTGRGLVWDGQGRLTQSWAKESPVRFNHLGQQVFEIGQGLEVSSGSPFRAQIRADGISVFFDKSGRIEARPSSSYVRNDSDVPGGTLEDALNIIDSRYRGNEWAGAAFPASVWDGRTFYRTDQGEVFFYSGSRALWLSLRTWSFRGVSAVGLVGTYFNMPGGLALSGTLGYPMPFNMILVEASGSKSDAVNNPTYEIRANGSVVHSFTIGAGNLVGTSSGLNVAVASGQVLSFYLNGTMLLGGHADATLRRTLT